MTASPSPNQTASAAAATTAKAGRSPGGSKPSKSSSGGGQYVAPFSHIHPLGLARTDQGVDFSGNGRIDAIGNCVITGLAVESGSSATGGNGPFLIYKLLDGDHKGAFIYIAENHSPTVKVGDKKNAGDQISTMQGGIETGFAKGPTGIWNPIIPYGSPGGSSDGPNANQNEGGKRFARFLRSIGQTTQDDPGPGSGSSTSGGGSSASGSSGSGDPASIARAAALSTFIQLPGILDTFESQSLVGQRSLLNDLPLLPFIDQLANASLRSYQSMPNGNFFAFFPDYFGGLNHRTPYWEIDDIEVIDGTIDLSDDPLATHVFVTGDTMNWDGQVNDFEHIQTSGVVTLFEAFAADFIVGISPPPVQTKTKSGKNTTPNNDAGANDVSATTGGLAGNKAATLNFLQKYGARPHSEDVPMIRSPLFELFLAYQKFMLLWSQQFLTTFTFTFMPELFPGGIVAFQSHGIQCYVAEVTHSFDYTSGFTTQANLMAPASLPTSDRKNVHEGMIRAFTMDPSEIPFDPFAAAAAKRDKNKKKK